MAATASVTISGNVTGAPTSQRTIDPTTLTSVASSGAVTQTTLAVGDNTFTIPPLSIGCFIQLPVANVIVTKFKGVAGDSGMIMAPGGVMLINWNVASLPASFVLNAAGAHIAGVTEVTFF